MDDLNRIGDDLAAQGWFLHLKRIRNGWQAELRAGVDILDAPIPRPLCHGDTWQEAVHSAITIKDELVAEYGKRKPANTAKVVADNVTVSSLKAGLPR